MITFGKLIVYIFVPLSLIFLLLLLLPFPKYIRIYINNIILNILKFKTFANINLIIFIVFNTLCFLLYEMYYLYTFNNTIKHANTDREKVHQLEGQRNFWITLLLFILWSLVYLILNLSQNIVNLENKLAELTKNDDNKNKDNIKKDVLKGKENIETPSDYQITADAQEEREIDSKASKKNK